MTLSKTQRQELRMKFGGKCAYCGCDLPERGWHADHVEPVWREWWKKQPKVTYTLGDQGQYIPHEEKQIVGLQAPERDTLENLFPSCAACNIDKHATSLETWRGIIADKVDVCRRNYNAFNHAERFGLVREIKKPVVFWFETFADVALATQAQAGEEKA